MITYQEVLEHRRSIRDFTSQKVDTDLLHKILLEACKAPSASNQQPWRFAITHDQDLMKRLSDESKKNLVHRIETDPMASPSLRRYEKILRDPSFNVFYNAPCLVIICGKNDYRHFVMDCSIAATYFMLAAVANGLGTCWIGLGDIIESPFLRKEMRIPSDYQIVAPIIIGYPSKMSAKTLRAEPVIL